MPIRAYIVIAPGFAHTAAESLTPYAIAITPLRFTAFEGLPSATLVQNEWAQAEYRLN